MPRARRAALLNESLKRPEPRRRKWRARRRESEKDCGNVATTMDHVAPVSRGGLNAIENVVPARGFCNSSKGTKVAKRASVTFVGGRYYLRNVCPTCRRRVIGIATGK
jgi:HNH endonuclease